MSDTRGTKNDRTCEFCEPWYDSKPLVETPKLIIRLVVGIALVAVFAPLLVMLITVFTYKPYWESKEWKERESYVEKAKRVHGVGDSNEVG